MKLKTKGTRKLFLFATPLVSTVVVSTFSVAASCSSSEDVVSYKLLPTYTGQADILMSLGIKPDYYPYQLNANDLFTYVKSPAIHMPLQSEAFKRAFAAKLSSLTPTSRGQSWWNQFALQDGEHGSDPEYWSHIKGDLVLYERYLLDDGIKTISDSTAPKHVDSPATFILTNFRNSRDPFTRIPKNIMEGLIDEVEYAKLTSVEKQIVSQLLDAARIVEGANSKGILAVDGKAVPSGVPSTAIQDDNVSQLYNDYVFARDYHTDFLDNATFNASSFKRWIVEGDNWVFDSSPQSELDLRKLFYASTFNNAESKLKEVVAQDTPTSTARAARRSEAIKYHHPIYEQQEEIGSAPMFEGAMRDNMLYLFGIASKLKNATTDTTMPGNAFLLSTFKDDPRLAQLQAALSNADKISTELYSRMAAVKVIVDKLDNPVFGIFTLSPGLGSSTIQSSSKYSIFYKEMGFSQPKPTVLSALASRADENAASGGSLFNMDDNGWWWDMSGTNQNIDSDKMNYFAGQFDVGFLTANDTQFKNLRGDELGLIKSLWKTAPSDLSRNKVDYNLWNEGLKAPYGLHMVIDEVLAELVRKYGPAISQTDLEAAKNWGDYFTRQFIA